MKLDYAIPKRRIHPTAKEWVGIVRLTLFLGAIALFFALPIFMSLMIGGR